MVAKAGGNALVYTRQSGHGGHRRLDHAVVSYIVAEIVHLARDASLLKQGSPEGLRQEDLASQSPARLLERNVPAIKATSNEMRNPIVQNLPQQILNAVTRNRSDVDQVARLKPVPRVAKQVVNVLDGHTHR